MRWHVSIRKLEFDPAKVQRRIIKTLERRAREAARHFLRAVIKQIPIQTGMARGSFLPIGRLMRVAVPIPGARPRRGRDSSAGARQQSILKIETTETAITITFSIQLFHYWLNETHQRAYDPALKPTPWFTSEDGRVAFEERIRVSIERYKVFDELRAR